MPQIRTPDQKLRIFISSTISELAEERLVVRELIEALHMTPVFFESGARPHPPRDLYRAYLEQSDIFIGIYYKSYGWVAPDMNISGIEDEWELSKGKPRLIYIKESKERDPLLTALIHKIESSGIACFKKFQSSYQLKENIGEDISILISERFINQFTEKKALKRIKVTLPILRNETVGRDIEIKEISDKLSNSKTGLITLIGPGGTGKTRLAIEVGNLMKDRFKDGVLFISLAPIESKDKFLSLIAQNLDINSANLSNLNILIESYLTDKSLLLILDNFEQIVEAGIYLSSWLKSARELKILVTSRTPLLLRSEILYQVSPLRTDVSDINQEQFSAAEKLFIQRVEEVNSAIEWDSENLNSAKEICKKLDGLPLAIELVAYRCRLVKPSILITKLEKVLDLASIGSRDLPLRQQTLRNTIQWSYNLLTDEGKRLFKRLSIFQEDWNLDSMNKICWLDFHEESDVEAVFIQLIDAGLVIQNKNLNEKYRFLHIIKEYSKEQLTDSLELNSLLKSHYLYFCSLSYQLSSELWKTWTGLYDPNLIKISESYKDIVFAFENALIEKNYQIVITLINVLNSLYIITGNLGFLLEMLNKAGIKSNEVTVNFLSKEIDSQTLAATFFTTGFIRGTTGQFEEGLRDLKYCRTISLENEYSITYSQSTVFIGLIYLSLGNLELSKEYLLEGIELTKKNNLLAIQIIGEATLSSVFFEIGDIQKAKELKNDSIELASRSPFPLVYSFCLYQKGFMELILNQNEEAKDCFLKCLELNSKYNFNLNGAYPNLGLAFIHLTRNEIEPFILNLNCSLECYRKSGSQLELICIAYGLCCYYLQKQDVKRALDLYSSLKKFYLIKGFQPWVTIRIFVKKYVSIIEAQYSETEIQKAIDSADTVDSDSVIAQIKSLSNS